jgi:hypothetical protein
MLILLLALAVHASTSELISSIPCEYLNEKQLRCRQTSFVEENVPLTNLSTSALDIVHFEWIESGAYILSDHLFDQFVNLKNLSLRANSLTSLSILPFWSHLHRLHHLDLSQNRLLSLTTRDFRDFRNLISLNISFNFLTTLEPIWLSMPLHLVDLSQNGINSIGYIHLQNSTWQSTNCLLKEIYLNDNRGLLSFGQLQSTIMDTCPWLIRFQLQHNHWHCACNDLINALKQYRTANFIDEQSISLTGQCETPLTFRHLDIQKMTEELVCDRLLLFDTAANDDSSIAASVFPRQIICLFLFGCLIGLIIGLCLHYCARRCHDLLYYILFKCDRQKVLNERHSQEMLQMNETINHTIYCPATESDYLPSYAQVMNEIFYLDLTHRDHQPPTTDFDGEC